MDRDKFVGFFFCSFSFLDTQNLMVHHSSFTKIMILLLKFNAITPENNATGSLFSLQHKQKHRQAKANL